MKTDTAMRSSGACGGLNFKLQTSIFKHQTVRRYARNYRIPPREAPNNLMFGV
jgi:hypothetical protein